MNTSYYFAHPWPPYATLGALVVLSGAAWLLYRKVKLDMPRWVRHGLLALRVAAIVLLCVYLMRPIQRTLEPDTRHSQLAVLFDTSKSMGIEDLADGELSRFEAAKAELLGDDGVVTKLGEDFRLALYRLGPDAERVESLDAAEPDGDRTDITAALRTVARETRDQPAAAVLLVSDGADNGPRAAEPVAAELKRRGTPVHTIAVGGQPLGDVAIRDVTVRRKVRIDTVVDVAVELSHHGFEGRTVPVVLRQGGKEVERKEVVLRGEKPGCGFEIRPTEEGFLRYSVELPVQPGEILRENNAYDFAIDCARRTLRVLYMEGTQRKVEGRDLWEHQYLVQALEEDKDVEVTPLFRDDVEAAREAGIGFIADPEKGFPKTKRDLYEYDVLIVSDIDIDKFTDEQVRWMVDFVAEHGGGLCMVGGWTAFGSGGYDESALDKLLPVDMDGRADGYYEDIEFAWEITPDGRDHPVMQIDPDPERNRRIWAELPDFKGFNKVTRAKPAATTLAVHPVYRTPYGKRVLLAVQHYGKGRSMAFTSDTTAGWGEDFEAEWGEDGDNRYYKRFWKNAVRWLAAYRIDFPSKLTVIETDRNLYELTESAAIRVHVLDSDAEPTESADVELELRRPDGTTTAHRVPASLSRPGVYLLTVYLDQVGDYRLRVTAKDDSGPLGEDTVQFACREATVEFRNYQPDPAYLASIAEASGGEHFALAKAGGVASLLEEATHRQMKATDRDYWDRWPFLLLVLACLGAEWALRKKQGLP